jgi:fatty acid desaturase
MESEAVMSRTKKTKPNKSDSDIVTAISRVIAVILALAAFAFSGWAMFVREVSNSMLLFIPLCGVVLLFIFIAIFFKSEK